MKSIKQLIAHLSPARPDRTGRPTRRERRSHGESEQRWPRDERLWRELAA